jgi:hypothetical protein
MVGWAAAFGIEAAMHADLRGLLEVRTGPQASWICVTADVRQGNRPDCDIWRHLARRRTAVPTELKAATRTRTVRNGDASFAWFGHRRDPAGHLVSCTIWQQCHLHGSRLLILGWTEPTAPLPLPFGAPAAAGPPPPALAWWYMVLHLPSLTAQQKQHLRKKCLRGSRTRIEHLFGQHACRGGLRAAVDSILPPR